MCIRDSPNEARDGRMTSTWQFMEEMAENCCKLLPLLRSLSVVRQWAGLYNMTPDKQPIYGGVPGLEGFYLAVGFSGHGFMFGPVTGVVMAETVLGLEPTIDASPLAFDRFEKGNLFIEPSVV